MAAASGRAYATELLRRQFMGARVRTRGMCACVGQCASHGMAWLVCACVRACALSSTFAFVRARGRRAAEVAARRGVRGTKGRQLVHLAGHDRGARGDVLVSRARAEGWTRAALRSVSAGGCSPSPPASSEGGFFNAELRFPEDFPNNPPDMVFMSDMWHPNGARARRARARGGGGSARERRVVFE